MPGAPTEQDAVKVLLEGLQRLCDWFEQGFASNQLCSIVDEISRSPFGRLARFGSSNPSQLLFDTISDACGEGFALKLLQRFGLRLCLGRFATFEHTPARPLGQRTFSRFSPAHLVHGRSEELDHMEPVHGQIGLRKMFLNSSHKAPRHVADHFKYPIRMAALIDEVLPKLLNSLLAFAFSGKDHRAVIATQINENGHIAMPAFTGGLVEAKCLELAEVNALHGGSHVVVDDSPKSFVRRAHKGGNGGHRHLSGEDHDNMLKEQGKITAWPCPRHLDPAGVMVGASDSGHPGSQIAVMLKEIQVPPSEFLEVVGLAVSTASRTGIGGPPVGTENQVEFMGRLLGVQPLAQNLPGGSQAQSQSEDVFRTHFVPPRRLLSRPQRQGQFHFKRRRTTIFSCFYPFSFKLFRRSAVPTKTAAPSG